MGQANAVGPTLIEGSLFSSLFNDQPLLSNAAAAVASDIVVN